MDLSRGNLLRWGKLIGTFFFGQGIIQLLQLVTGFLIVNWLTKDAYATFTLVMAIQGTTAVLVELGVSQSLGAFIGSRFNEPKFVGRYIAACRYIRDRLLILGSVGLLIAFYLMAPRYGWTGGLWLWLWLSVVVALVFQAWGAIYGPLLLLREDLKSVYKIESGAGVMRLGMMALSHLMGILTAPLALIYGALQALYSGLSNRALTRSMIEEPAKGSCLKREKKELLGQAIPRVPSAIFFAVEGKVTIFLISIFGTTSSIAELGALGRLAMLFMIFQQANGILIGPYFAKMRPQQVLSKSALVIAGASVFAACCSLFVYCFPEPFLWALGESYSELKFEVFLLMSVNALNLVTVLIFTICLSRKYIFPWYSIVDIGPVLVAMVAGFIFMDLSQLVGVLYFSLLLGVVKLCSLVFVLVVGLGREDRDVKDSDAALD